MSNIAFIVPKLRDNNAWLDYRSSYPGGFGWRGDRNIANIQYAVNHHSVTDPSGNAKKDVDLLWQIHKSNGWGGIGYHFVITSEEVTGSDGMKYAKVAQVGDIGSVRAHTPNTKGAKGLRAGYGNDYLIAAVMIGQLHINNPSEAQIRSAYWLYRELILEEGARMPALKGTLANKLTTHYDWDPTACSGNWGWQKPRIVDYQDPPKIENKKETRVATIPFESKTVESDELPKGETRVVQEGRDGSKDVIWEVTYTNGKETSRKIVGEVIKVEPVTKITAIGTYIEPPKPPEPPVEPPVEPTDPVEPPVITPPHWLTAFIQAFVKAIIKLFGKK